MLATKSLAGVAPEVILRNPLHPGDEASEGIHPGFETQSRHHREVQNSGFSGFTERIDVLKKFRKKGKIIT